jgi:rod shape determining protein RodA
MIQVDRRTFRAYDYPLLSIFALLLGFGVLLVASASASGHYRRQAVWAVAAIVLAILASAVDYRKIVDRAYELWGVIMIVLVGMLLFAPVTSGAQSWLGVGGVGIQPSELAKVITILALAHYFAEREPRPFGFAGLLIPGLLAVVPFVLIALQPDLGTASTFLPMVAGIAWVAGIRLGTAAWITGAGLCAAPLGYIFLLKPYQRDRLLTFWNPEVDPLGDGYQIIQSKIAVGSGGLMGKGLFSGTQSQLEFLPAQHTDLVFAVLGEELGFLGVAAALALYLMLMLRVLQTARISRDRGGTYIATGVAAVLLYHMLVNVGMVIGFAPITGIPLPLLSYGGSSALATGIAVGLVISVRTRRFLN